MLGRNQKLLVNLADSEFGVITEVFIIQAIGNEAQRVASMTPEDFQLPNGGRNFVCPDLWIKAAQEVKAKLDNWAKV